MELLTTPQMIGREIRAALARKNLTARDLADYLDVDVSYASVLRYLRGERDMPATILLLTLRWLDEPVGDFADRIQKSEDSQFERITAAHMLMANLSEQGMEGRELFAEIDRQMQ